MTRHDSATSPKTSEAGSWAEGILHCYTWTSNKSAWCKRKTAIYIIQAGWKHAMKRLQKAGKADSFSQNIYAHTQLRWILHRRSSPKMLPVRFKIGSRLFGVDKSQSGGSYKLFFFCAMYYVFPNAFERVLIRFWTGFERVRTRTLFLRKWVWTGLTLVYAMCYVKWSFFLTRTCGKIPQTWNWSQILPNMVKTLQKWKGPLRNPPKHVKCKKKT